MPDVVPMTWIVWTIAVVLWLLGWVTMVARSIASKTGDKRFEDLQVVLIVFTITTFGGMFLIARTPNSPPSVIALWCHHAAFLALYVFLIFAQYFQAEGLRNIQDRQTEAAARSYRRLWLMTVVFPPPIALCIFLTGLRLVWQAAVAQPPAPGKSPATFWLLAIIVGFSFFFWDGIMGYTPIVTKWKTDWESAAKGTISGNPHPRAFDRAQLFIHFLSWPVVFLCGVYRWEISNPISDLVARMIQKLAFLPRGWPEVTVAVIIWLFTGGVLKLSRLASGALWRDEITAAAAGD